MTRQSGLGVVFASTVASAATVEVVAGNLNSPRGLAFAPNGDLYVAEAGTAGTDACAPGEGGTYCFGPVGSITRIDLKKKTIERIATGLPSGALTDNPLLPPGSAALGPAGISF